MPSHEGISDIIPPTYVDEPKKPMDKLFSLAGKTIAITGGGRGVGITLATAVLETGGNAACIDILPEPSATEWSQLKLLAKKSNLQIDYHRCDITKEEDLSKTIDDIAEVARSRNAPLSGAVACAGIQQTTLAIEYPASDSKNSGRQCNWNIFNSEALRPPFHGTEDCRKYSLDCIYVRSDREQSKSSLQNQGIVC
jgi:NAD(P)-dependent dehydrogenase (short-subunit alcohol dehydrogenase family)